MGNTMTFFAGNADKIGPALANESPRQLYELRRLPDSPTQSDFLGEVDFSMHLGFDNLDDLSREAGKVLQREPICLSQAIGRCVAGDSEKAWEMRDWSADVVKPAWVDQFPAIPDSAVAGLASAWAMSLEVDLSEATHIPEAIVDLIRLCRRASSVKADVVFSWSA